jgi:hypothetical protein
VIVPQRQREPITAGHRRARHSGTPQADPHRQSPVVDTVPSDRRPTLTSPPRLAESAPRVPHRVTGTEPVGPPPRSTATTLTDQIRQPQRHGADHARLPDIVNHRWSETRADFWNPQAAHCPVEDADAGDAPSSATSATVIAGSPEPDLIRVVIDTFPAMICGGRATQQRCEHQVDQLERHRRIMSGSLERRSSSSRR